MRSSFHVDPEDHEHACRLLEALCEGYVLAMIEEIDAFPDGQFPCCVKCGGFRTRNAPLTPAQAEAIEETLGHGHPVSGLQRHNLAAILEAHGYGIPTEQAELEHGIDPEELATNPPGWGVGGNWGTVDLGDEDQPDDPPVVFGGGYDSDHTYWEEEGSPQQQFERSPCPPGMHWQWGPTAPGGTPTHGWCASDAPPPDEQPPGDWPKPRPIGPKGGFPLAGAYAPQEGKPVPLPYPTVSASPHAPTASGSSFGRMALAGAMRNRASPGAVQVRSAREILNSGGGSTVELACFQCAQKRREGADVGAKVIIVCTIPGTYRGVVLQSPHHIKAEKRGCIDDPVKDARPVGGCGCARSDAPG